VTLTRAEHRYQQWQALIIWEQANQAQQTMQSPSVMTGACGQPVFRREVVAQRELSQAGKRVTQL
jgi:hypothetical protein